VNIRRLAGLSTGHLITDVNQGAVIILVPVVRASLGLSIGAAALMVTVSTVTSSLVQPLFGILSDRVDLRWMIPAGVLVGSAGTLVAALAPSYPLVLVGVLAGGLGIAAFHPEAARWAGQAAGRRRATGMSYFAVGGNAGYGLGVLGLAPVVARAGRAGAAWVLLPGLAVAILLARMVRIFGRRQAAATRPRSALRVALTPAMVLLLGIVALRSAVAIGTAALTPLYLHLDRHLDLALAGTIASLFLLAGAVGTLFGGPMADRFGRRRQILGSFLLQAPLLLGFLFLPGGPGYLSLLVMGAVVVSTFSVTVAMAQELAPGAQGTASGLVFGFGFGAGGLGAGLLGALADHVGLHSALLTAAALPVLALPLVLLLPETHGRSAKAEAEASLAGLHGT
jgi:FSR family fosmidomycin resistance protein-like MFS transporter